VSGGLEFLNENAELITNVVAAAAAIGAAWGFHVKFVRPKWQRVIGTWDAIDRIENEQKKVAAELTFNGGRSTKDIIGAVQRSTDDLSDQLALVRGIQRAIMNTSPSTAFFETDAKGRHVWVNRGYLDLTGKQLADVLVNGWGATIAPEDRNAVLAEWNNCIAQDRDFDMTYRVVDADRNVMSVRSQARRVKTQEGLTIAWAGSWVVLDPPPMTH